MRRFFFVEKHLTFKIYTSTNNLPENWDSIAVSNVFLNSKYLNVLQNAAPSNMHCHFIGIFSNDTLVGVAVSQYIDLGNVNSYGNRDNCFKTKIKKYIIKKYISNILFVGNNMLTGQNAFCFDSKTPISDGILALKAAGDFLKRDYKKKGINIHLTVYKDFDEADIKHFKTIDFEKYHQFTIQPNMILNNESYWKNINDYENSLTKKYRDQYKRARKKATGIEKRKLNSNDLEFYEKRIYELYLNVANNAPFNTFYLTENHFEYFKKNLLDSFLFYGYFINESLIGFSTLVKNGNSFDTYFLGYDSNYQKEKMLYLNMLYDMLSYSIKKQYKQVVFGRTALEIKSSIGAKPIKMYGLIMHHNPLINIFTSKLFQYFEPQIEWIERSPFKENIL